MVVADDLVDREKSGSGAAGHVYALVGMWLTAASGMAWR